MDGRALARRFRAELEGRVSEWVETHGAAPSLAVVLVGAKPDSVLYSQNLVRWFGRINLGCSLVTLEEDASQEDVVVTVRRLSEDDGVTGILVQMPLPPHLDSDQVAAAVAPLKDVEGLHPENIGYLSTSRPRFVPSTPLAGLELLDEYGVDLRGKHVAILGRSNVVGRPFAQLALQRDATVTVLHSRSRNVGAILRSADVVAAAAGRPGLVVGDMIAPGAVVLDFGINFVGESVVGDVVFEDAVRVASLVTPVPGGVGPLTNVVLARNLMHAAELQAGEGDDDD